MLYTDKRGHDIALGDKGFDGRKDNAYSERSPLRSIQLIVIRLAGLW